MTRQLLVAAVAGLTMIGPNFPNPPQITPQVLGQTPGWRACTATLQFSGPYPSQVAITGGRLTWRGPDAIYLNGVAMPVPYAHESAIYPMPDLTATGGRAQIALVLDGRDAESDLAFYLNGPGGMFGVWSIRNHWFVHWIEFRP